MTAPATVSRSWVNTVLQAAEHLGVPRTRVLARAGLAASALRRERWPVDHITRLWRAGVATTGDRGFGLKAGTLAGPASFNIVSHLLQSAATLRAAVALAQTYQPLISGGGRIQFIAGRDSGWLVYHPRQGSLAFSPQQIEAVLAACVQLVRWLTAADWHPHRVQFAQPRLAAPADYRAAFGCPVRFEQAFNGIEVDNAALDAALPQADAQRVRRREHLARARLAALAWPADPVATLRDWIAEQITSHDPPDRAAAATALGLGERTLARRLKAAGTSYAALRDDACRTAALAAVAGTDRPLADIAHALGYAEPSPFWRAFKRWTGLPPDAWRRHAMPALAPATPAARKAAVAERPRTPRGRRN